MAQLSFNQNSPTPGNKLLTVSNATLTFVPFLINDSISFKTMNMALRYTISSAGGISNSFSIGLYSLNGSTLSLNNSISAANSWSNTIGNDTVNIYLSLTATSATQNISAGQWFFGLLVSSSGSTATLVLCGGMSANPLNAFLGKFAGGAMTASTNALPSSIATSDLDITGNDAMFVPYIILSS